MHSLSFLEKVGFFLLNHISLLSNCLRIYIFSLFRSNSKYEWELYSKSGTGNYVAVGLSSDDKMGDDLVMSCGNVKIVIWFLNN